MATSDNDFTLECWQDRVTGEIKDFRVTRGTALYRVPWYRRLLMRLIGRSHWHHFTVVAAKNPVQSHDESNG